MSSKELNLLKEVIDQTNKSEDELWNLIKTNSKIEEAKTLIERKNACVKSIFEDQPESELRLKLNEAKQIFAENCQIIKEIEGILNSHVLQPLNEYFSEYNNLLSLLIKHIRSLEEYVDETLQSLKEERRKCLDFKTKELSVTDTYREHKADMSTLIKDMANMNNQLNKLADDKNTEITTLHEEISVRGKKIKAQDEEIRVQSKKIKAQDEEISIQGRKIKAQDEEISVQSKKIKAQEEEISVLKKSVDKKSTEITTLHEEMSVLKKSADNKSTEITTLHEEMSILKKWADDKSTEITTLHEEMSVLKKWADDKSTEITTLHEEMSALKKWADDKSTEITTLHEGIEILKKSDDDKNKKIDFIDN